MCLLYNRSIGITIDIIFFSRLIGKIILIEILLILMTVLEFPSFRESSFLFVTEHFCLYRLAAF